MKTLQTLTGKPINIDEGDVTALETTHCGNTRVMLRGGQSLIASGAVDANSAELDIPFESLTDRTKRKEAEKNQKKDDQPGG